MKKILLFLILFISSITLVNATSDDIVYDWGNYVTEDEENVEFTIDVEMIDDEIVVAGNYLNNGLHYLYILKYNQTGKIISSKKIENIYCSYGLQILEDKLFCQGLNLDESKLGIYDYDLKLQKELNIKKIWGDYYKEETEKYYIINENIIDKSTNTVYDIETLFETHEKYSNFQDAITNNDEEEKSSLYKEIVTYFFGDSTYGNLLLFNFNLPPKEDDNISYDKTVFEKDKIARIHYNSEKKSCGIEIYDNKYNEILTQDLECDIDLPKVLLYDNSFIIINESLKSFANQYNEYYFDTELDLNYFEYDYKGNVIHKNNLHTLKSPINDMDLYYSHGRRTELLKKVNGGFLIVSNFRPVPSGNINNPNNIDGELPTILKYSYIYDIATKSDGNGTITATKVQAGSGEEIKYEITPKEGYVLGVVKITDSNGNTITTTNSTFTMPSSDITIEVTFVAENPDTASKTLFIFSSFLIIITSIVLMVKQIKEFKWIKN